MPTSDSTKPDRGNLGDDGTDINLSGMSKRRNYDPDEILHKNIMKLDKSIAMQLRQKHNLSGVIIIAFEDLEKQPDQIRLINSCKFKKSAGKIGKFMESIIRQKQELM